MPQLSLNPEALRNLRKLESVGRDGPVQKDVLIVWDLENARVPVAVPIKEVERAISNAFQLLQRRSLSAFWCSLSQGSLTALQRTLGSYDVEYLIRQTKCLLAVDPDDKAGNTDVKLIQEITDFISGQKQAGKAAQSVLVLITGDNDYTKSISAALDAGMDVEVLHPPAKTSRNLLETISGRANVWHHDWLEFLEHWLRAHNNCHGLPDRLELPEKQQARPSNNSGQGAGASNAGNSGGAGGGGGDGRGGSRGRGGDGRGGSRGRGGRAGGNRQQNGDRGHEYAGRSRNASNSFGDSSGARVDANNCARSGSAQREPETNGRGGAAAAAAGDPERDSLQPPASTSLHLAKLPQVRGYSEPALALSAVVNWLLQHRFENTEWFKGLLASAKKAGCKFIFEGKELYNTGEVVVSCLSTNQPNPEQAAHRACDQLRNAIHGALLDVPSVPTGGTGGARAQAFWPPSFLDRLRTFCPSSRMNVPQLQACLEQWKVEVPALSASSAAGRSVQASAGRPELLRLVNLVLLVEAELGLEPSTLPVDGGGVQVLVPVGGPEQWALTREEEWAGVRGYLIKRFSIRQLLDRLQSLGLQAEGLKAGGAMDKADLVEALMKNLSLF